MISRRTLSAIVALMLVSIAGCAPTSSEQAGGRAAEDAPQVPERAPTAPPADEQAATQQMTIDEAAGRVIMTKLSGTEATHEELDAYERLGFGGVILFGPNVSTESQLTTLIANVADARIRGGRDRGALLVSVDQEGGSVRNVPFAPPDETQNTLANRSASDVRTVGEATGRALAALGISMVLGPVADLAQGPNRTMAGRSFGSDPAAAAERTRAYVEGLQSGGVAATVKHFPGFGAATGNSDDVVAYVDRTSDELARDELVPFRAALDAGVAAVMVSHGIHRSLNERGMPGTLDPDVGTTLLRGDLRYDGLAVTDSMNARGMNEPWGDTQPRACPVALAAGMDLLLLTGSIETARLCRRRIIVAVEEGTLSAERVREAAARVDAVADRYAVPALAAVSSSRPRE